MILTGHEIKRQVGLEQIIIEPFDAAYINPNSYNFHLGPTIKIYKHRELDASRPNDVIEIKIPKEGLLLQPDTLYLGHIAERIGSNHFVPIIKGLSSIGRLGLFIVITADLVDLGAFGNWTMQLHCVQPVRIYPGMPIGQMTFWRISGQPLLYSGKYQNSTGPMQSLSYKDKFFSEKP